MKTLEKGLISRTSVTSQEREHFRSGTVLDRYMKGSAISVQHNGQEYKGKLDLATGRTANLESRTHMMG